MSDSDKAMLHAHYSQEELLANKPFDQWIPTTCVILTYEVGDLVKCALNKHWGNNVRAYQGEASTALADVITMSRLLAALLQLDYWKALREGEERYMEAMSIRETRRDGLATVE